MIVVLTKNELILVFKVLQALTIKNVSTKGMLFVGAGQTQISSAISIRASYFDHILVASHEVLEI